MQTLFTEYRDRAAFFLVYIKEAHPRDGWISENNTAAGIEIADPQTQADRNTVAIDACALLNIIWPALVDTMDNAVSKAWAAWPDRVFVVDAAGRIAVQARHGPYGFSPGVEAAREWLAANLS